MASASMIPMLGNMTQEQQLEAIAAAFYGADKPKVLGPYLIGFAMDIFLCGVMFHQFFRWIALDYPERPFTQVIVYSSFGIAMAYSAFALFYHMRLWVYNFGSYHGFAELQWMQFFMLGDSLVAALVQAFYTERACKLLGAQRAALRAVFLVLVALSSLTMLGGTLAGLVLVSTTIQNFLHANSLQPIMYCWLGGQLAADVLISSVTAWALWISRTGWKHTDVLLVRLIKFTAETQLPSTLIALIAMIYYSQQKQSTIVITLCYVICKPYVIGLLAVLNGRERLRGDMSNVHTSDNNSYQLQSRRAPTAIHVHTETYAESHPAAVVNLGINRQESDELHHGAKDGISERTNYLADSKTDLNR